MSNEIKGAMDKLRDFLERVYIGSRAKWEETKAKEMLKTLYYYF